MYGYHTAGGEQRANEALALCVLAQLCGDCKRHNQQREQAVRAVVAAERSKEAEARINGQCGADQCCKDQQSYGSQERGMTHYVPSGQVCSAHRLQRQPGSQHQQGQGAQHGGLVVIKHAR